MFIPDFLLCMFMTVEEAKHLGKFPLRVITRVIISLWEHGCPRSLGLSVVKMSEKEKVELVTDI